MSQKQERTNPQQKTVQPTPAHILFERERQYIAQQREAGNCLYQPLQDQVAPLTQSLMDAVGVMEPVAFQIDNDTFVLHNRLIKARANGAKAEVAAILAEAATLLRFRWFQVPARSVQRLLADTKRAKVIEERMADLGLAGLWTKIAQSAAPAALSNAS